MPQLKVLLFGPPRITRASGAGAGERDGQPVEIGLNKSVALLVYLAVTKQSHSRDALATLLWPDADQRTALGYLRRALYRVNQTLKEDILTATRKMIEFNHQLDAWLDTEVFQTHVDACLPPPHAAPGPDEECIRRLTEAAELYRDDFLAGFTLPDSPAFDEWQFFQAESLRRSLGRVLEQLANAYQAGGEWEHAIAYARRWLALDPLEEPAHRCLMELYAQTDQQAAAVRQYAECHQVLAGELGVSPQDETTALYEAIKSRRVRMIGVPAQPDLVTVSGTRVQHPQQERAVNGKGRVTSPGPPHNLPVYPNPFIGRKEELAELRRLLVDDACCRLVTLTGPGGIGKTHLALEAAHGALRAFADGVYFIPLAALTSAEHLVPAIAKQLGLRFYEGIAAREPLLNYLCDKRMLLVLDNFEHLLPGAGLIPDILQTAPGVKTLITSRERLNLSGEILYTLGGMAYPQQASSRESPQELMEYAAVQLLIHYARLVRPAIELTSHDYPHIARICRLVQGMPLALVLAAGWLEVLSFKEIAEEISQSLDFLEGPARDLPERQRSVRAAFEYSWKRLSEADQRTFSQLSVFQGGFARQAAHRVASADLRTLRKLIDKSLISTGANSRYTIHELLRQYAAEQLEASGEAGRIRDLHSEYYLAEVSRREAGFKGGRQCESLDEIDVDLGNIRAAWDWALERKNEAAINRSLEGLYLFFSFRGRHQEGVELFEMGRRRLAPCLEDEPTLTCGRMSARLAWLQSLDPKAHENIEVNLRESLSLAQKQGERAEMAFCLLQLGCYHRMIKRDPAAAMQFLEESLEHYEVLKDSFYKAVVLHWLGSCHALATDLDSFVSFTRQSLELARETGNKAIMPYDLRSLTLGALGLGDYAAAEGYCQDALSIDVEMGLRMGIAESKSLLGLIRLLRGDLNQARALAEEGLEMARQVGFPPTVGHALATQSLVKAITGDAAGGQAVGNESLDTPLTSFGKIMANWGLSMADYGLEGYDAAWRHVREALAYAHRISFPAMMSWPLPAAALILAKRGRSARAVELLSLALNHPMSPCGWMESWDALASLHADLEAGLGTEIFEAAWERGSRLDLETAVAELLDDQPPA